MIICIPGDLSCGIKLKTSGKPQGTAGWLLLTIHSWLLCLFSGSFMSTYRGYLK